MAGPKVEFTHLTPAERLELIGEIWDSLDSTQAAPITPELGAELDRRSAEVDADPEAGRPWPEVRDELRRRLG